MTTLLFLLLCITPADTLQTLGLMLTWQQDPTSTITIDWHTPAHTRVPTVQYRAAGSEALLSQTGESTPFPYSTLLINRVELSGLDAGTLYEFKVNADLEMRTFRTMPKDASEPIRFIVGGDVRGTKALMERVNRMAATFDPDFIVWGGDLAYADGLEANLNRWLEFMDAMKTTSITADNRVIPVITGIGNHEVKGYHYYANEHASRVGIPAYTQTDASRRQIAPYYFSLMAFPGQPGYGVLDFGTYLSIVLLDTDHANPIEGEQTDWLKRALVERSHIQHIIPNYHVPAYPSVRSWQARNSAKIREHWLPVFEEAGIEVAFENHDHAYKRTKPMLGIEVDANGIVFIGDGAWGVGTRPIGGGKDTTAWTYHGVDPSWYLERATPERHFIITTIQGKMKHFLMVNEAGEFIDEFPRTPHFERSTHKLAPRY